MNVEHELSERTVQMRHFALHEAEAGAGELRSGVEVKAEGSAHIDVILDLEVELARRAPAADLDVFRLVLADRRRGRGEVRNAKHQVMKLRARFLEFVLEFGELSGDFSSAGEKLGRVLACLLLHADVLREGIARSLKLFGLLLHVLAAVFELSEGLHGKIEIARLQASHHFRKVLPEHRHIEHVYLSLDIDMNDAESRFLRLIRRNGTCIHKKSVRPLPDMRAFGMPNARAGDSEGRNYYFRGFRRPMQMN